MSISTETFNPSAESGFENTLLELLFDRMPMGIAILDLEFNIQKYNPTWADFSTRYAPPTGSPLTPGVNYFDHLPGTESVVEPLFNLALTGKNVRQKAVRLETGGVITYWDIVIAPLTIRDKTSGILVVSVDITDRMEGQLNLERRVKERTIELERRQEITDSLRDIIGMINANTPLDEFLDRGVKLAAERLNASACVLHQFDINKELIYNLAQVGMDEIVSKGNAVPFSDLKPRGAAGYLQATLQKQPTYTNYPPLSEGISQIQNDPDIPDQVKAMRISIRKRFAGSFSVPLYINNQVYGGMVFYYKEPQEFSNDQIQLGLTFAEQVGIAIENARLFEKVEETAVTAERNRLARDLHDAVTQTLFSSSLIADVLPKIWEKDPEEGHKRLEELRQLTSGALSEMRTLLVELRPAALADADLSDLIGHLVNAFRAKTRISVDFDQNCMVNPPLEIKEMFYRITQETFNNISKHANANQVLVSLDCQPKQALLVIKDDGEGFDTNHSNEGLGLSIMDERAENLGANLKIKSRIGDGTEISVSWQIAEGQE